MNEIEPQDIETPGGKEERPKARNLTRDEKDRAIQGFQSILKGIKINDKPLVLNATQKYISTNPEISIEEIQQTLGITESTKLDFIRQIYIRSGQKILKQLFPEEEILSMPIISFIENGHNIAISY